MTATYEQTLELARRTVTDVRYPVVKTYTFDPIWVLYDRVLRIDPAHPDDPARDRFYLSKGHGPSAFYAVLAAKGFFPAEWLDDIASPHSRLGSHPDATLVPGVEISSGSLGHGLPLAVGTALGLRATGFTDTRVFVLVGDAELDEGSNHEAIQYAGAVGLANLHVVVADNASGTVGWPGGIASRFEVNGWSAATVGLTDHDALYRSFTEPHPDRPRVTVASAMLGPH
ncbi:thiamine pyrophosphate-dependent enzyme [Glycomyces albidus]|uniref:Transketolase n=1 Tax=Glycomyces albidus TaxID=2656774 RepID=A0A6L5GD43_9ACTN|nr:transketolase [Glycomyces albidus]MQM27568.1 transketolase [Glycomyces albidus]